jgi:uncharacterized protein
MQVSGLAITAVKGTRLRCVDSVVLDGSGVRGDRRFYLIDDRGRMINGKHLGSLCTVLADWDEGGGRLALTFPDGRRLEETVSLGDEVQTQWYSRPRSDRLVVGPWAEALSGFVGQPLRLVQTDSGVDRGATGAVSLVSRGSLARLASVAGESSVDGRRFRMLIEADGVEPHEEDGWAGHRVRIGGAVVRFRGHVGRCLVTSRDPDTGVVDLPTLDILGEYRWDVVTTEPLPFGIYGEVVSGGPVAVGDPISLDGV